jgi:predicted alpha-1,6-mannanase (GH76 family)
VRRLVVAAFVVATTLAVPAVTANPVHADSVSARRAVASLDAMERYLFDRRAGDYRDAVGSASGSHAWPFSQALQAHAAVARLAPGRAAVVARLAILERRFRSGPVYAAWPGGSLYVDDNEWLAEAFLDIGGARLRTRAAAIFDAAVRAWDGSTTTPCSGGVYWTNAPGNDDRNTVTTANAALVGLRLYELTHTQRYLAWSQQMLAWVDACMRDGDDLYFDHIDAAGRVDQTKWSYNQGSVLAAYVELYRITRDVATLDKAESIADASVQYYAQRWYNGEPREFAAIFFRNLLQLAAVDGRQDYVDEAAAYGDAMWQTARDPRTGLFRFAGRTSLLDQAALVQVYAALARAGR